MILKILYQCATNVPITIHTYEAINVHHVNIPIFSRLFHLVNIKKFDISQTHNFIREKYCRIFFRNFTIGGIFPRR